MLHFVLFLLPIILSFNKAQFILRIFLSCRIQFNYAQQKCDCRFRRRICVELNSELILLGMSASGKRLEYVEYSIWRTKILSENGENDPLIELEEEGRQCSGTCCTLGQN